jgi:hypothetical protein
MRKKVDQRIRTLVENSVKLHQRSMFVIVGDRGRDQARCRLCAAAFALRGALVRATRLAARQRAHPGRWARATRHASLSRRACVRPRRW